MWDVIIRRCGPEDSCSLSIVAQATFLETYAGILPREDIISHCLSQHCEEKYVCLLADGANTIWIAEVVPGKAPVGYLVLTPPDLPMSDIDNRDLEVKRLYLLHRFQGQHLGSRLMGAAQDHANETKIRRLLLGVYTLNLAAIGFYTRLGYEKVGKRVFKVGSQTYDDFIFGLTLHPGQ